MFTQRQTYLEKALLSAVVVVLLLTTAGQCAMLTDDLQTTVTPDLSNSTLTPQIDSTMEGPRVLRSHRPCSSEHANYCHNGGECMFPQDSVEPSCICTPAFNGPRCMYIIGHFRLDDHGHNRVPQLEKMIALIFGVIMFILALAIVIYFLAYKKCVKSAPLIKSAPSESSV